jgi:DNA-binding transcriptional ArsR family regulator
VSASPANLDGTLAALADPARRRAVELLREQPQRAGELADALGISPWATSRLLNALRRGGLLRESHPDNDARVRIYSLDPTPVLELRLWLEETQAMWEEQMQALKAHLEGK